MAGRVAGKVALISGGSRGIGEACARALVAEGASVVITDVLDEPGAALASSLGEAARYLHLDVSSADEWEAAVAFTVESFGKLDVLVNNAGIANGSALQTFDPEQWQRILDINLTGTFLGMQKSADAMIAAGGGSMINMSSIEGLRGTPWAHGYVAAKWAVRGLTKSVALELAVSGRPGELGPPRPDQDAAHRALPRRPHPDPARPAGQARGGRELRAVPGE